jgi:hypothetical protein
MNQHAIKKHNRKIKREQAKIRALVAGTFSDKAKVNLK